jgi:hypothetical protein
MLHAKFDKGGPGGKEDVFFYTPEDVLRYRDANQSLFKKIERKNRWQYKKQTVDEKMIEKLNRDSIRQLKLLDWTEYHRTYNTPVFMIKLDNNTCKVTIDPCLKEIEFHKVKDPFTAFQDIQSFISGVLGNIEKEIITVGNDVKIHKAGFDKWSFRKPPQSS